MKKKIVIKVCMNCDRVRSKAMSVAAETCCVRFMAIEGNDLNQLVVTGEGIDSTCLTRTPRKKVGDAMILKVKEVKLQRKRVKRMKFKGQQGTVPNLRNRAAVTRCETNAGPPGKYVARVKGPAGISLAVRPSVLVFYKTREEKEFKVVFKPKVGAKKGEYVFGSLVWSNGKHRVRSPIVDKPQ